MAAKHGTTHKVGLGLVIGGVIFQVISGFSVADATLNGIPYADTAIGTFVSPVEDTLHIPSGTSGWFIAGAGLLILFAERFMK